MQKLIKITDDHYVVVDDSEIKEGDFDYSINYKTITFVDKERVDYITLPTVKGLYKKITHSTQPLECDKLWTPVNGKQWMCNTMLCCGKILNPKTKPISLQEVKELIGEVDVEKDYVLSRLCVHNKRNPDYIPYDEDDELIKPTDCSCDNCFYGRTILSEKILQLNRALEDNKEKKYTQQDIINAIEYGINLEAGVIKFDYKKYPDSFTQHLQSLQPKTKWEVEIVDGKLKLK